jgi:uncharacterized protein (DUF1015 family)
VLLWLRRMATLTPFRALRPRPDLASEICELPYDVMSSAEARETAAGRPLSFLQVSKPEIGLPPGTDSYAPEVYARGREAFLALIAGGQLHRDRDARYYLYRQEVRGHRQTGIVGLASCREYLEGIVKKHELTRPDKEDDRVRHIDTLESQTGPVFLTYRASAALDALVARLTAEPPEIDFTAADGVRHSSWMVREDADTAAIAAEFSLIPALYIADGHHRSAAAARVCRSRGGTGGSGGFLSVVFPHDQLRILPYNRVLKDLNGRTPAELLAALEPEFELLDAGRAEPANRHEVCLFLEGVWHRLRFREQVVAAADLIGRLDVSLLQDRVLAPLFGIDDPRTSQRVAFVGGVRGTAELERLVGSGAFACAFSMYPTGLGELLEVADAGKIMPPKSTWFEPKLRDAMFCHML